MTVNVENSTITRTVPADQELTLGEIHELARRVSHIRADDHGIIQHLMTVLNDIVGPLPGQYRHD
jgi:hypothetical protein